MTPLKNAVRKHPVLWYYVLVFTVSWGGMLIAVAGSEFPATKDTYDQKFPFVILALIVGPTFSSLSLTAFLSGRAGLKDVGRRLLKWRVGAQWYATVLIAPATIAAVVVPLSLASSDFRSGFLTADDPASLLVAGLLSGLAGGLAEEIGWTGFVIPRLKPRYGVLVTGFVVGLLWGGWHLLVNVWASDSLSGDVSRALFLPLYVASAVAQLTAFRILMVWVYDHTESLFLATLLHASLIVSTFAILAPDTDGASWLVWYSAFTVAICGVVAAIASAGHWQFPRRNPFLAGKAELDGRRP